MFCVHGRDRVDNSLCVQKNLQYLITLSKVTLLFDERCKAPHENYFRGNLMNDHELLIEKVKTQKILDRQS